MIEVHNLSKRFGTSEALCDFSLTVKTGASAIISDNRGSGKTTLLRLLAGLERPDSGEVYLGGELASNSTWVKPPHQRELGFMFQTSALWPHMTVAQNVAYGLDGQSNSFKKERLAEVLELSGLSELAKRYPSQLSGGQSRRAALARSLAPRPKILLLDEPLVYLDPDARGDMVAWVQQESRKQNMTVIWVTHNLDELEGVSDQFYRMAKGRILLEST